MYFYYKSRIRHDLHTTRNQGHGHRKICIFLYRAASQRRCAYKENNVGVLTLQLTQFCGTTHTVENITLKCTKVYPVLIANVSVSVAVLEKESLRTFINEFVSKGIQKELDNEGYISKVLRQEGGVRCVADECKESWTIE